MINTIKLFDLDVNKLPPCHSCERKFTVSNPPTDMGVYVDSDGIIKGALLCRVCREKWFNLGCFTLNLSTVPRALTDRKN